MSRLAIVGMLIFLIMASCKNKSTSCAEESPFQQPINPNGDSELALLMRSMYDEAEQIKQAIESGRPLSFQLDHEEILTAEATEPEKAASDRYHAFANGYLQTVQSMKSANREEAEALFSNMVNNCMACHQAMCPGPIVKIKKLL